jgi:Uma2 family endonuclease
MAIAVTPPSRRTPPPHGLRPLTYDEVQQFPEDDGLRYELVDGELLVTPAPNTIHQLVVTRLVLLLVAAAPATHQALVGPVDWYVRADTYFEPDLVVVGRADLFGGDGRRLTTPPLLAVEVLSPSTAARDEGLKLRAYEDARLAAYWVVDPVEVRLTVRRLVDGRFGDVATATGDERLAVDDPFPVEVAPGALVR